MKSSTAYLSTLPLASAVMRRPALIVLLLSVIVRRDANAFQTSFPKQHHNSVFASGDKVIGSVNNFSNGLLLQPRRLSSYSTSTQLFGKQDGEDSEESTPEEMSISDDDTNDNNGGEGNMFTTKVWPTLKIALPSFLVGGVATLCFLFLPLLSDYYDAFSGNAGNFYGGESTSKVANSDGGSSKSNINNVNQPVILFETILNDLNDAYVDDVDIQKLFETGVKAMTASLDPYTEFESRTEAAELEESVTGRYGGVGLVIRGGTNLADASDDIALEPIDTSSSAPSPSTNNKKQPKNASKKPPVAVKDADDEEELDIIERKRARRKSMEEGVRVASAFEGYAYDAGMRVGDKLLAVDDFRR